MRQSPGPDGDPSDSMTSTWRSLGRTLRRALRHAHVLALAAVASVPAAIYAPRLVPPVYVSQAALLHRELIQATSLLGKDAQVETVRQRGSRLKELLMSRTKLEAIVREFSLFPEVVEAGGMAEAVDELTRVVDCRVGDDTYTIKVSYRDAVTAQGVTRRLAESLIEEAAKYRREQAAATMQFLEAQSTRAETDLDGAEQRLASFIAQHPEFAQDVVVAGGAAHAGASVRAQERKAAATDPMIVSLERQRSRLARRIVALNRPNAPLAPPIAELDPITASTLTGAKSELDRAKQNHLSLSSRYTEAHPDVVEAGRRLALATTAYDAARADAQAVARLTHAPVDASPDPDPDVQRKRTEGELRAVQDGISRAQRKKSHGGPPRTTDPGGWLVDLETQWTTLNRAVSEVRERHQQLERRYFQAAILADVETSGEAAQMVVVDPAYVPERPVSRGPRRVAAVGAAIVLLLGIVVALLLGRADERLYDESDLERLPFGAAMIALPHPRRRRP